MERQVPVLLLGRLNVVSHVTIYNINIERSSCSPTPGTSPEVSAARGLRFDLISVSCLVLLILYASFAGPCLDTGHPCSNPAVGPSAAAPRRL